MTKYIANTLIAFSLFLSTQLSGTFGYISTSSYNIGDDIQTYAAKQFLPSESVAIDREYIGVFKYPRKLPAIINGWFMHTKDFCWYLDAPAPKISWPPSNVLDPLLISIHLAEGFIPLAFSAEAVSYLKMHAPVGARDLNTLNELRKRNIPCYFSGCLTLTLNNNCSERNDIIYAVDIDDECVEFIRSRTNMPVEKITHIIDKETSQDPAKREEYMNMILEKYKRAKCVVTLRLHAAMPCLALQTPVLLINNRDDRRFHGLRELVVNGTRDEFLNGEIDFDFDNPAENPKDYLILRENLINTITDWISKHA